MTPPALRAGAALAALVSLFAVPATASAAVKTKVALVRDTAGVRIEVKVSSTKRFTKATKPRGVKVTAAGAAYKLKKVANTRKSSTWRSDPAAALEAVGGQKVKVRIAMRGKTRTVKPTVAALSPSLTPPAGTPTPQIDLTRDDVAAQTAMSTAGDLLLEWASFGASGQTAEYRRIWMLADGTFRLNVLDWNSVSGEMCREAVTGTWVFKEGYTTTYNGGGVVVKVTLTLSNGQTGDDIIAFSNVDPNNVWVGVQLVQYARNPQIMQNC
jgi:hypothetical protein